MKKLLQALLLVLICSTAFSSNVVKASDDDLVIVITDEEGNPEHYYKYDENGNLVEIENPNNNSASDEAAKKAEEERIAAEKAAAEKAAAEKAAAEKAAQEKAAAEEAARKAEAEKAAAEKAEAEKAQAEKEAQEKESLNTEKTGNNKTPNVTLADAQRNSGKCKKLSNADCGDIYDGNHGLYNFSGGGVDETYDTTEIETLVYEKLNTMRKEMGLAKLVRKEDTARDWAEVMTTTGLFEHATLGVSTRYASDYACKDMTCSGENILINATRAEYSTPEQIAESISNQWNNSDGHYANRTQNYRRYTMNDGGEDYLYYDIAIVRSLTGHFWAVERFGADVIWK